MTDESGKQTVGIPTCRAKAAPGAVAPNQSTAQKPRDTKQVAQARLCPREEGALPSFFPSHRTGGTEPPVSESTKKVDSWLKRRESMCVLGGSRGKSPPANAEEAETPGTSRCSEASDFRCAPWGLKPRPCHCTPPTARHGPGSLSCSLCAGQGTEQGRTGAGGLRTVALGAGPLLPEYHQLLPPVPPCPAHASPVARRDITDADHQSSDLLDSSYWGSILHPSNLSPWQQ